MIWGVADGGFHPIQFFDFYRCATVGKCVLVVRMNWADSLDHVVAVDLWRGRIIDSEEKTLLRLTQESLPLCARNGSHARITELREVADVQE